MKRNLLNIEKSALYVKSRLEAERSYAESLYNLQDKVEGNPIDNTQSSIPKGQKRRGSTSQRRSQYHDRKGDDNRDKATGIMSKPEKNATALEHMYWHDANTANLVMDMCNDGTSSLIENMSCFRFDWLKPTFRLKSTFKIAVVVHLLLSDFMLFTRYCCCSLHCG